MIDAGVFGATAVGVVEPGGLHVTAGQRIQRGFHRIGLLFMAFCAAFAGLSGYLSYIKDGGLGVVWIVASTSVAALTGYSFLLLLGWAIAGFFPDPETSNGKG
jgi:hypothetical protein